MKKIWMLALGLIAMLALLVGCGSAKTADSAKMKVVTTVYPVYDLAKHVGGDKIDLHLLVPPGAEPHDWEPTANDLKEIGTAKVFLYSGAGLEPTDKLLAKDVTRDAAVVEVSKGLELLPEHHDEDGDEDHDHHNHDADEKHEHHHHGEFDPHVWLDPMNVAKEVDTVVAAFSAADPANKAYYEDNGKKYKEELTKLDQDFQKALKDVPNRNLVVSHEAYGYLAHRYGFEQLGILGIDADAEPTPEQMAKIVEFVRAHNVKTIYSEELISPKLADAIAKESGAKVTVLNPIEGLTKEQMDKDYDYIKLQRENLATLVKGQQ